MENLKFSIKKIPKIQLNLIEEIFWEMQQKKVQKKNVMYNKKQHETRHRAT